MTKVTSVRKREDYTRLVAAALLLSVGVLVAFQIYMLREPSRIQSVLAADQAAQIARGQQLFADNCTTCHGDNGEGDKGPALNSQKFLKSTDDGTIFSIISSGVPGTAMPTWAQPHGGPFTDEQIRDLVSFIRQWEPTAPNIASTQPTPDASKGQAIFSSICYACHGDNGQGTKTAPALNSQDLLSQFDDNWFRQTIANGRPAKGMPTWGAVLSPEQINDVVAYIRAWQTSPSTTLVTPTVAMQATAQPTPNVVAQATTPPTPTVAATAQPTPTTAVPAPTSAVAQATTPPTTAAPAPTTAATSTTVPPTPTTAAPAPTAAPTAAAGGQGVVPNCGNPNCSTPGAAIAQNLKGDPSRGATLFTQNCQKCHGSQGKGGKSNPGSTDGTIPALNPIDPEIKGSNATQFALSVDLFIEHGSTPDGPSPANVMDGFGDAKKLTPQQVADLIAYIMSLNP
jgi:cytochrome c oxidase cbb3-type subunit 3